MPPPSLALSVRFFPFRGGTPCISIRASLRRPRPRKTLSLSSSPGTRSPRTMMMGTARSGRSRPGSPSRPRGSEAVTWCPLGTFPKTMLGDGRPMRRIPAFSGAGPRELSRRWSNPGRFKTPTTSGLLASGPRPFESERQLAPGDSFATSGPKKAHRQDQRPAPRAVDRATSGFGFPRDFWESRVGAVRIQRRSFRTGS